jgi:hypothetical protein
VAVATAAAAAEEVCMMRAMGVSFFDMFFDNEYRQRRDINAVRESEGQMAVDMSTLQFQVGKLQRELRELGLTVAVLVKMLQAQNPEIDPKVLHYRVEAEIESAAQP